MAKKLTYHFYLKDKWSTKPTPINLAINSAGFRKKYGIGESISPEWWDDVEERAIEDNRQKKTEKFPPPSRSYFLPFFFLWQPHAGSSPQQSLLCQMT